MMKPRAQWDREDLLDYLDGWHDECGLRFRSQRPPVRVTHRDIGSGIPIGIAGDLMKLGREDRIAHREATGI